MEPSGILTLTTDFGWLDSYVGQLKGAALSVDPRCVPVDLCHGVPPQDVRSGAYVLETGYAAFPPGTVHVAIVDPGVGTSRSALVVRTPRYYFVAPDNGLLTRVLRREPAVEVRSIENRSYHGPRASTTFEGRDRFVPAAAHLARGTAIRSFGPCADAMVSLLYPPCPRGGRRPDCVEVLHVDRYGNAALDLPAAALDAGLVIETHTGEVRRSTDNYVDHAEGPFLIANSAGYVELAVSRGSAARDLGLSAGHRLQVRWS